MVVAKTALTIGRSMGLNPGELTQLKRCALVHDLGKAAVPVGVLDKGHNFSASEWERFRLHPYYTERVLSQIAPLSELSAATAADHLPPSTSAITRNRFCSFWVNLTGSFRSMKGTEPRPAAADKFTDQLKRTDSQTNDTRPAAH